MDLDLLDMLERTKKERRVNNMGETIWIGNAVRVGSNTPRYLYNESERTIYFRTLKDKCEIAFLDKKTGILYINHDNKMQFKAIKRQIIKDYVPKNVSSYINMA